MDNNNKDYRNMTQSKQFLLHDSHKPKVTPKGNKKKTSGRKKKWKKPIGMPKRPLSAYNLFFQRERRTILKNIVDATSAEKTESESSQRSHGRGIGFANLAKLIAGKWKTLDQASRGTYAAEAQREMEKYQRAIKEWRRKEQSEKSVDIERITNFEDETKTNGGQQRDPNIESKLQGVNTGSELPELDQVKTPHYSGQHGTETSGLFPKVVPDGEVQKRSFVEIFEHSTLGNDSLELDATFSNSVGIRTWRLTPDVSFSMGEDLETQRGCAGLGGSLFNLPNQLITENIFHEDMEHVPSSSLSIPESGGSQPRGSNAKNEDLLHILKSLQEVHEQLSREYASMYWLL